MVPKPRRRCGPELAGQQADVKPEMMLMDSALISDPPSLCVLPCSESQMYLFDHDNIYNMEKYVMCWYKFMFIMSPNNNSAIELFK